LKVEIRQELELEEDKHRLSKIEEKISKRKAERNPKFDKKNKKKKMTLDSSISSSEKYKTMVYSRNMTSSYNLRMSIKSSLKNYFKDSKWIHKK